ncbi:transcriptional regulator, partial [Streptomyces sp. SID4982]|nr:transcriptional regulator [Streptomyces sp. SID4982]
QSLHIEGTPGQRIGVYTADPGTPDHDAMTLLDMTAPVAAPGQDAPRTST